MQTAEAIEERLGIVTSPLGDTRTLDSYRVTDEALYIDPNKPFIVFNGDGYFHNSTLGIVKDLIKKRRQNGQPEISYVHIDGHDDIAPPEPDNFESYKSFVLGIDAFNRGGVHILQEGLTGQQDGGFIQPSGPESWGETTDTLRDPYAYVSIDIDVLDIDALRHGSGIYHLFPQSPIGFDTSRLNANITAINKMAQFVGADIVGFSRSGASEPVISQSYDNIAKLTEKLVEGLTAESTLL